MPWWYGHGGTSSNNIREEKKLLGEFLRWKKFIKMINEEVGGEGGEGGGGSAHITAAPHVQQTVQYGNHNINNFRIRLS